MTGTQLVRNYDLILLQEADSACRRARLAKANGNSALHGAATFTAIVTAATATEAYLSEILARLEHSGRISVADRERIRGKDHLWKRFNALVKQFRTTGLDHLPLYSEYQALIRLRHAIIHRSAEFVPAGTWPEDLRQHRTVIPHAKGAGLDWTSQLLDVDTGAWARRIAKQFLASVKAIVPEPP